MERFKAKIIGKNGKEKIIDFVNMFTIEDFINITTIAEAFGKVAMLMAVGIRKNLIKKIIIAKDFDEKPTMSIPCSDFYIVNRVELIEGEVGVTKFKSVKAIEIDCEKA